jgi:hypothetical protein
MAEGGGVSMMRQVQAAGVSRENGEARTKEASSSRKAEIPSSPSLVANPLAWSTSIIFLLQGPSLREGRLVFDVIVSCQQEAYIIIRQVSGAAYVRCSIHI